MVEAWLDDSSETLANWYDEQTTRSRHCTRCEINLYLVTSPSLVDCVDFYLGNNQLTTTAHTYMYSVLLVRNIPSSQSRCCCCYFAEHSSLSHSFGVFAATPVREISPLLMFNIDGFYLLFTAVSCNNRRNLAPPCLFTILPFISSLITNKYYWR
jgi:hypothetical protein